MRQALRGTQARAVPSGPSRILRQGGVPNLVGATIPAPVKGWDTSDDSLADMDPAAAIILDNWFPELGYVRLRAGHSSWATGLGSGPVESLMAYHGATGTNKMFGARGTNVYDVTSSGAVGAAAIASTSNARFQHTNMTTSGGHYLLVCNGAISVRSFDGSSWATPSITGITSSDAIHINLHQHRVWFVLINSTQGAYLPTDSIAGAASTFDFGPLFTEGGYLNAIGTWTMDSGWGPDDYLVAISSRGQLAVYAGTDPSSSDTWALKGVYKLGAPIGRRCFTKVGGDLAVITVDGVVSLSQAIQLDRTVAKKAAITSNISRAMNDAAQGSKGNFGWQLIQYPLGRAVYLNVPLTESTLMHQYVMNPLSGAWCRYTGMNMACWENLGDVLYAGGLSGVVYKTDTGNTDNGAVITADLKTAFNYFGSRGTNKSFRMLRANMFGDGRVVPTVAVNGDFRTSPDPSVISSVITSSGALWNSFNWNDGTLWSGGYTTFGDWIGIEEEGHCAAIRMKAAPLAQTSTLPIVLQLNSFDIRYQRGGFV